MFGIGMPELMIILVIALVVLGPQKLPEIARSLGKGLAEFKRAGTDFARNLEEEGRSAERERLAREGAAPEKAHDRAEEKAKEAAPCVS